jgi:transposase
MRAYSLDLRERVLTAVDTGMPRADVLTTFRISRGTLQRWLKRRADGLPLAGRTGPGRPAAIRGPALDRLHAQLEAQPAATLEEHTATWNTSHPPVSRATMARSMARLKQTHKNSHSTPARKTRSPARRSRPACARAPQLTASSSTHAAVSST